MPKEYQFVGKSLSITQPWATAIAFGGKNIENRKKRTHYRGPLAIHASNTFYYEVFEELLNKKQKQVRGGESKSLLQWINQGRREYGLTPHALDADDFPFGEIIALAMVVDCVDSSSSPWFDRYYKGWILEGIIPIQPVSMKGKLGIWDCRFKYTPV